VRIAGMWLNFSRMTSHGTVLIAGKLYTTIEKIMGVDNGVHLHLNTEGIYALNLDNPNNDFMVL
jgi:hypothetical protein